MADSRHNKYVSVTDWFSTPASASGAATDTTTGTGIATSGASFAGGSWGSGGGGENITIIKTNDTTPASNSNVYSALRVHNTYIAKDKDERTTGKLSSDQGFEVGEFVSGTSGALLYIDPENLQTTAELDRLYVRVKAYFETLEIVNVNSVGGKQLISPAGSVRCFGVETTGTREIITEVQSTDEDGNLLYDENGDPIMETVIEYVDNGVPEDVYRCYFLAEQDGQKVENRFHVNDQAYSQTFNVAAGESSQVSNRYYWRLVTGVSTDMVEFDGKQCHYIDLSILDCDVNSDVPQADDIICHRGSRTESDRQNVLEFSAVDNFSPSITLYQGIGINDPDNDLYPYSLVGKDVVSYGVNQSTNLAFMNVYGNMYIGDRNGDQFLRFDDVSGLTIKANLDIGTKLGGDDLTLEERIELAAKAYEEDVNAFKDAVEKDLESIQNQIDGAIETYFYDPEPTLNNPPASNWDDTDKANHVGDLYYSGKGKAYRFQYDETNGYYWNIITDTDITLALTNAKKAQDTADSKRKIFTERPATNDTYDIGDMWVNANYTDTTYSYNNDLLRAVTAKAAGTVFSIDHWTLASKYTDDTFAQAAKEAADDALAAADLAQSDANAANTRLESWAADGVISPTEKQGIKEEWARVFSDKDHIVAEYNKYGLGEPTAYNEAYLPYITDLIALFQSTPENIPIPSDFDDKQTAYYEQRTLALGEISVAAKKLADDAQAAADNAQKEAEAALNAAEEAKTSVSDLKQEVTEFKSYTDGAFADGILNSSERTTIKDYVYQIETTKVQVDESYNEVISNSFLTESIEKTNLQNSYNLFSTATSNLVETINNIAAQEMVENIDRATFNASYNQFNSTYSDYNQALYAATKFIEYAINSKVDDTIAELGGYSYLKSALNSSTTIDGGLVLTSMIALGYYDDNQEHHVMAGINGIQDSSDDIALWSGGPNIDKFLLPEGSTDEYAKFLVRRDGTGYAAGGNFYWDSDGTIHADPLSFVVSDTSVGALLASFQVNFTISNGKPVPTDILPKVPFQSITLASDLNLIQTARISFNAVGSDTDKVYFAYDETNNAVYVANQNGNPVNFYTTGGISMYGGGNTTVSSITDVIEQILDPNTLEINDQGLLTVIGGTGGGTADAVAWDNITGKPTFATVATSGKYSDLSGTPTIPTIPTSLKNPYALVINGTSYDGSVAKTVNITASGLGALTEITSSMITDALGYTPYNASNPNGYITSSALSDYATTSHVDSITAALQGEVDGLWARNSFDELTVGHLAANTIAAESILNLATVATSGSYNDLSNKPTLLSSFTNDVGYLTSHQSIYTLTLKNSEGTTVLTYTPNSAASSFTLTKGLVGLYNVENTALSTWAGTNKITTLGTISTGTWQGTKIANAYLANSAITINGTSTALGGSFNTASITAGSAGTSSATSGYTLAVPYVTMNKYGIVTAYGTHTHTLNSIPNSSLVNSSISISGTSVSLGGSITQAALRTALGLGSNAYTSTAYLPSSSYTASDVLAKLKTVDGNGSGLDADTLDGIDLYALSRYLFRRGVAFDLEAGTDLNTLTYADDKLGYYTTDDNTSYTNTPSTNFGLLCVSLNTSYTGQLMFCYNSSLYYRSQTYKNNTIEWNIWHKIAYTTDNVASATKLQTARTIWGQSFDGTGNVTGTLTLGNAVALNTVATTGVGYRSLHMSTSNNLQLGYDTAGAGYNTYINGNNIYFSYSTAHAINMIINSSGNVGIGTTSPSYKLHVNGSLNATSIYQNGVLLDTTIDGYVAALQGQIDSLWNRDSYNSLYVEHLMSDTIASAFITSDTVNSVSIVGTGITAGSTTANNGTYSLYVTGSGYISSNLLTGGGITMYSSEKLKDIVDEKGLSLKELSSIKPIRFTWKDKRDDRIHIGGIAEDILKVLPEVIYRTSDDILTMDYGNAAFAIASSLIKPVISHEERIARLERENRKLKEEIKRLKTA